jgi:hypothetical protein
MVQVPTESIASFPNHQIWGYPAGPLTFIPIYATGPEKGDIDVSRMVISSYVTTLNALHQAQKANSPVSTRQPNFSPPVNRIHPAGFPSHNPHRKC